MKWFLSHMLMPVLFSVAAGFFLSPILCIAGFIAGLFANYVICQNVPLHRRKLYIDSYVDYDGDRHMGVRSDFLWYHGRYVTEMKCGATKREMEELIKREVEKSKRPKKERMKDKYSYIPPDSEEEAAQNLEQEMEHVKNIASQYGVKGGEALAKIEEIRKKTYDESAENLPVVTKVTEHTVEFTQDGRKKGRSRKGFTKQYGEPAVKKETKKTRQRAKA